MEEKIASLEDELKENSMTEKVLEEMPVNLDTVWEHMKKLEDKEQIMMAKLADAKASQQIMGGTLVKTKAKITKLGARMNLHVSVVDQPFFGCLNQ
jgi:hypothetical protein